MTFLLDVNVLIALMDPTHVSHDLAHRWYSQQGSSSWATCPITENGIIRIISHSNYPNTPGSPALVVTMLERLKRTKGYNFWPDNISLMDDRYVDARQLLSSRQVTDSYLLALAVAHRGKLATLDRRLTVSAVHGGHNALHLI